MDLSHSAYEVLGKNRARVLLRLSLLTDGVSGRTIHRLSGVKTLRTTQDILSDLTTIGLVDVRRVGSGHIYSLNREHILWAPIDELLATPARLEKQLAQALESTFAEHAAGTLIYGSFARNEAGPDSDIDILVVWNDTVDEEHATELLDVAAQRIRRLTGNDAQLFAVTLPELAGLIANEDPLIDSLRADARPLSSKATVKTLLGGAR